MLSLLQDIQENDQRLTMLQLVDKMKVKNKGAGKLSGLTIFDLFEEKSVSSLVMSLKLS